MEDLSGQAIKGYELRERIGKGGFGAVYRAYQPAVEREVAIKIILSRYANQPEFIRGFEVEAQLIARLEHPFIVPLYDYWREPDSAYLVMRYLRGGSLTNLLQSSPLSLDTISRLLDQIAQALSSAHRNGVVHLDIKPDNILLDEEGNAYLTDFGIARDLFGHPNADPVDFIVGSPDYIPPEQFNTRSLTPQADIYSLGIVLFQLLTGELPFRADSVPAVVRKHMSEPIPPVSRFRPDVPRSVDRIIARATAKRPEQRYLDALGLSMAFQQAVGEIVPEVLQMVAAAPAVSPEIEVAYATLPLEPINPYKGLRAFEEADAPDFFGRDALVHRLIERLVEPEPSARFLAVVGPSGSGKSSAVKAGLIPALREGALLGSKDWFIVTMVPGAHPLDELAAALLKVAVKPPANILQQLQNDDHALLNLLDQLLPAFVELVLVVDQFEEVFTQIESEAERAHFLNTLFIGVMGAHSRLRVIITLRADFYDRPLLYSGFGNLVRQRTEAVVMLSPEELEQTITGPAERVGLTLESGLVAAIIADVNKQPGTLPLLQYALMELFARRKGHSLTREAYTVSGGVLGALARRAEETYQFLDPPAQEAARRLFLRLVTPGEGGEETRRRVLRSELTSIGGDSATMQHVIEVFGQHRLLSFDREPHTRAPTVEVAHEALIREWKRLREWIEAERDNLRVQRRLALSTAEWLNTSRDASFLATGARLTQFELLAANKALALNDDEKAYLDASLALRERAARRLRLLIIGLIVFALAALGLAAFAVDRQNRAQLARSEAEAAQATAVADRDRADTEARTSRSRELALSASTGGKRLDLSLLLSLEALNAANTYEARSSLLSALQSTPRLKLFLQGHTDRVRAVAYSPDGTRIVTGSADTTLRLWDAQTGDPIGSPLTGHTDLVNSVAFSPDGTRIVSASSDRTVRIWDANTGQLIATLAGHTNAVWSAAFSPDGKTLASGGQDSTVMVWDVESGTGRSLAGHTDIVYSVAFSPDGKILASGSADRTVRLWDVTTGELIGKPLEGHADWVLTVAFSPDGRLLASSGVDRTIIFWDVERGESPGQFTSGQLDRVRSLAFSPDGRLLASGSADRTVRVWDLTTGDAFDQPLTGHTDAVWSIAFSPDSGALVSASADGTAVVWDLRSRQPLSSALRGHRESVSSVAFNPDDTLLASSSGSPAGTSSENSVRLWDVRTGETAAALEGHTAPVTAAAFHGDVLAAASLDRTISLWRVDNPASPQLIDTLAGDNSFLSLAVSDQWIAAGDERGRILLWDAATHQLIGQPLVAHGDQVASLAFSPDGRLLASGSRDTTIVLWDTATWQPVGDPLAGHTDGVLSVAFSPDGKLLASGSRDATVILWDVAARQPVRPPLTGHTNWVLSVAFSPDGTLLASGSGDNRVILWDVATGRPLGQPLAGHVSWVNGVAFSHNGLKLASASRDTTVMLWDASVESWEERACRIAHRGFTLAEWAQYFPGAAYRETCSG